MNYLSNPCIRNLWALALISSLLLFGSTLIAAGEKTHSYQTFENDPLNARIYELDNGLRVYMTVYKDEPRIQTCIAVRAGSKNDPADATGLAHYLEHLLFKGTDEFGTMNFEREEVEIERIIDLFERRYHETDSLARAEVYRQIDSTSYSASQFAISNEYEKLMDLIGAKGTNAYTSDERTVYINDIPSNQLEKWLTIEAERFRDPIFRLFHTELEIVYEEKNRGLDDDWSKIIEVLNSGLYQNHPYGTQTTIGSVAHLKNPSLKKVIDFYETYYVPNNMAICLSGDLDPDKTIRLIDQAFGRFPKKDVAPFIPPKEEPIERPIIEEVWGPDAEGVVLGFRLDGVESKDPDLLRMFDMILNNRVATDLNTVTI